MLFLLSSFVLATSAPVAPMPQGERITTSLLAADWADVSHRAVSPDGAWVVYFADQPTSPSDYTTPAQIYSVPTDRSAEPVRLNDSLVAGDSISFAAGVPFQITADSSRVVFIMRRAPDFRSELFSAPIHGGGPAIRLHPSYPDGGVVEFELSADGSQVVYRASHATNFRFDLWIVPVDGSSAPVQLTALPISGANITEFELSPTGSTVVYLADMVTDHTFELWSSPTSGALTSVRLSGPLPHNSADIGGGFYLEGPHFRITPDGSSVFYVGEQTTLGVRELFRAPIATPGSAVNVSETLVPNGDILRFDFTPDGNHVVFRADKDADEVDELFSRPTDLSTGAVRLNGNLPAGGDVLDYTISPDSNRIVYRADQDVDEVLELFSVPVAGGTPEKLNDTLPAGGVVHPTFEVTPNSSRVVFRAEGEQDERIELYGVAIDGSAGMIRLSPNLPGNVEEQWSLTANGLAVAFVLDHETGPRQLYSGATSAVVPVVRLDPGTVFNPGVGLDPLVTAGNVVVYTSEQNAEDALEIFSVPLLGGSATNLNGSFAKLALGDVTEYVLTPSGDRVVYLADADRPDSFEVYVMPIDGSEAPIRLNEPTPSQEYTARGPLQISPDGTRVLYFYGIDPIDPMLSSDFGLYIAPLDRSTPQQRLSHDLADGEFLRSNTDFSPDSSRVLFHVYSPIDVNYDFYSVPSDGSTSSVLLADLAPPGGYVLDWAFTPDYATIVYRAEQGTNDRVELYRVPADGSGPPVELSEVALPTSSLGDVADFALTPDGSTVVYIADQTTIGVVELYSRPVDASAPSLLLSVHPNAARRVGYFDLSPDGTLVAYNTDGDTDGMTEIYRVPVDGSASPVRLSGTLANGGNLWLPRIDPTQTFVVYYGDGAFNERRELFSVPLNGSTSPVTLNDPIAGDSDVWHSWNISPDGSRAVFLLDRDLDEQYELYSAPLDGSQVPAELSQPLSHPASDVGFSFQFTPDGSQVVYFADPVFPGIDEIFSVPTDGSRKPRRLARRLGENQDVYSFEITSDGQAVVYHADQRLDSVDELFRSSLGPRIRRATKPEASVVLSR